MLVQTRISKAHAEALDVLAKSIALSSCRPSRADALRVLIAKLADEQAREQAAA